MIPGTDFYQILGVTRDATPEEIRSAYFELARRFHPDHNPDPGANDHFLRIKEAYDVLSNTEERAEYDNLLPPPPPPPAITVNLRYSRSVLPKIDEPQLVYGLLELTSTVEPDRNTYPPLHLCLVIDRSTSMQGDRMDMVKANANQLLRQLQPNDMISVVSFSDRADVVIPSSRISEIGKFENRISLLSASGGTEIYQGLEAGVRQLQFTKGVQYIRQLLLLTDGHTYGDEEACLDLARKAAVDGITINGLGIGHEWNDTFLDKLASISGGNSTFIATSKDLFKFLEQKLSTLMMIYAKGVTFHLEGTGDAKLRYAFRLHPEVGPLPMDSPICLGNLLYGRSLTVLLEFVVPKLDPNATVARLAQGYLEMEIPSESRSAKESLKLKLPISIDPEMELPPAPIIEAMSRLTLYRLQDRARHEVETGNIAQATRHLQYLATHLLANGDRELAHTVLVEAEHVQQSRRFSKEGDKRIKYGTRALLLPSGIERG